MTSKVIAKWTSALLSALFVGPASAGSVFIHEEPTHPNYIHPAFRINPERGKVAVQVSVNDFPGDYDSYYSDYIRLVKGLVYDRASHVIRYGDAVCAKVSEHQLLITRWHFIDETGACLRREAEGDGGRQRLRQSLFLRGDGSLSNSNGRKRKIGIRDLAGVTPRRD